MAMPWGRGLQGAGPQGGGACGRDVAFRQGTLGWAGPEGREIWERWVCRGAELVGSWEGGLAGRRVLEGGANRSRGRSLWDGRNI